jgi:hypothetical protein
MSDTRKFALSHYDNGPVGDFYRKIVWKNGYENWDLIRINTASDGHCLFHAIANSFFVPYHTEILEGNKIKRIEIVKQMRKRFSENLSSPISSEPNAKTHYEIINSGKTAEFPLCPDSLEYDFSLNNMKKQLDSNKYIGYGYIEYISNILDKNIYILNDSNSDLYPYEKTELPNIYKKNRSSIVLYFSFNHYELVGIMNNGIVDTYFDSDHTFIKFLYNRVLEKIKS